MPIEWITPAPKKVSAGEDAANQVLPGLLEGAASLPGSIGDMGSLARMIQEKVGGALGGKPSQGIKPPPLVQALAMASERLAGKAGVDPRLTRAATAGLPGNLQNAPTSQELVAALTADKPLPKPQTRAGKYTRTISQFLPAVTAPANAATRGGEAVRRVANAVVPAVASEAAGQATEGTPYEPYARVAAALAGGLGVNMVGRANPDTRLLAEASRGATDAQVAQARQLMEQAQARGVRLTMAEALQQVTDGGTGMGRMQRVIEGTEGGNTRIGPVMAQRPNEVSAAVRGYADTIAPPSQNPYVDATRAQEAAGQTLTGVRQQINANARPWYEALQTERMPPTPAAQQVMQSEPYRQALAAVRNDPILNAEIANLPDDSLAVVNEVTKQLDTLADNFRPNPATNAGNAQLSAAYDAVRGQVDELASAYSEPWRLARSMVASGREAFLDPLQSGPMGRIAQTAAPSGQTGALFPTAPAEGAPGPTAQALQMLPEDVSRGLVRQQVMTGFNEAAQDLSGGPNQWGGAMWAARQFGNPEQAATMRAGVEAVTGNAAPLDDLVSVLRATGRRERPGSMTAYNSRDLERLGEAGVGGEIARTGLNAPGTFRRIGQALQNWQTERNAGRLADAIIASPEDAERILMRAREVVPAGAELQAIERLALQAQLSLQGQ